MSEVAELSCILVAETDRALLLRFEYQRRRWFPKSLVEFEAKRPVGLRVEGTVTVPQWLAEREGLV